MLNPRATCDGYPRAPIETVAGMCAGLVAAPEPGSSFRARTIHLPRTLLQISANDWLVSDLGAWVPGQGVIWKVSTAAGQPPTITRLLGGLDMPHTLAKGPDGKIYVGEMGQILRFDAAAANPAATRQAVIEGLPDNRLHDNRHPLSSFIFDRNNDLLVNVGAPSDQCAPDDPAKPAARCAETEGPTPSAVVRRYAFQGNGRWSATPTIFARGLRNSLAMALTPSGAVIQAENSIDPPTAERPYDEINRLVAGRHYGWPYCIDWDTTAPAWPGQTALDCGSDAHAKPVILLPPHAAPLSMAYYQGAMFPQLKGRLLVSFHGYRSVGARLVAYAVDGDGFPTATKAPRYASSSIGGGVVRKSFVGAAAAHAAEPLILTPGWEIKAGVRPHGWPVGVSVAADGSIWIADDKNGAIVRLAQDRP